MSWYYDKSRCILAFVKAGRAIVPLTPRGKEPAVARGVHGALSDRKATRRHFKSHQDQNYGVATGNGIFVIDVDGEAGKANWGWSERTILSHISKWRAKNLG